MEGAVCWDRDSSGPARGYTLVYRTGIVEGVAVLDTSEGAAGHRWFPLKWVETQLAEAYSRYAETLRTLGLEGPVSVMVSLVGARGVLAMTEVERRSPAIDRQLLFVPEVVIDDLSAAASPALLPAFELLWMACGVPRPATVE